MKKQIPTETPPRDESIPINGAFQVFLLTRPLLSRRLTFGGIMVFSFPMMTRSPIIGVMGGGIASVKDADTAYRLGGLIAKQGWILLNGGRKAGIMDVSAKGAKHHGGLTIGILPDDTDSEASEFIDIPIITGMGNARNCINVLTSDVVVACPGRAGTLSEIALSLKYHKPVVLLNFNITNVFEHYRQKGLLHFALTPEECINKIKAILAQ